MNQHEFEQYLQRHHTSHAHEPMGRNYKNAFGIDETIILPKNYWEYVDWLVDNGIDIQEWITECDKHRDEKTLSENFMEWLHWDECERHREGSLTPSNIPPLGFQE